MLDEVELMKLNAKELLAIHQRKEEAYLKLFKICLEYLKGGSAGMFLSQAQVQEEKRKKQILIESLETLIKEHPSEKTKQH